MIPKVIHYCWFGKGILPKSALKCIDSWRRFFPDYEVKEWNEDNFDVNIMPYTQEAYQEKKYAFVSDVARFWILQKEGGIYFDTDVEVVASFDDIISKGAFMGVEIPSQQGKYPGVNPGLGIGAEAGNKVISKVFDYYKTLHFIDKNGEKLPGTVVTHTTNVLVSLFQLKPINEIQHLDAITVYPIDFFNPFNDLTGELNKTENTHSIHWFSKSWIDKPLWYFKVTRLFHRLFGTDVFERIKKKYEQTSNIH